MLFVFTLGDQLGAAPCGWWERSLPRLFGI